MSHWRKLTNLALPAVRVHCIPLITYSLGIISFTGYLTSFDSFPPLSCSVRSLFSVSFQELIQKFQLQSQSIKPPSPLAELQSHMDMLQVSQQTVEGAT